MMTLDTTNMCSHLQKKLFDEDGAYHRLWLSMQDDSELTAVVRSRQCKPEIKKVFEIFADRDNYPMYFHCNIGTDRTGMIAYLLNAYLGVNEVNLYFDYLFSNFGLIALPNAYSSDPTYKTLSDLTKPTGAAGIVSSFAGNTLSEKAKNCLLSCGISEETLTSIRSIFLD